MIVNTHLREGYPHQTGLDLFWQTYAVCIMEVSSLEWEV